MAVIDSDFEGISPDADNYARKINQIEIPHKRADRRYEALTEEEQSILRSELGKFMRVARVERLGAI